LKAALCGWFSSEIEDDVDHTSQSALDSVPIGTYLDFDMSQCRTDFKYTADNLSSSFRAFYR
jgi:hypothetical protein